MQRFTSFHDRLYAWYARHGRQELPWRNTADPYAIYISEVMLQQTQVQTVLGRFYFPFLEAFPSLQALADAPEDAVLKRWEGLGYYSRARNLHRAAMLSAPQLPDSVEALMALPGIGKNTAHAILSFAFRQPFPVLEANVKRVIHRIYALSQRDEKLLWHHAWQLLDRQNPFDYNQAMMDLGALVCLPKAPRCDVCPAASICKGKKTPLAYPEAKQAKRIPTRHLQIIVVRDAALRYFLVPRKTRFLGGLYGFIERDIAEAGQPLDLHGMQCIDANALQPLGEVRQVYSHFKLHGHVVLAQLSVRMNSPEWVTFEAMEALALSEADKKVRILLRPALL